MPPSANELDSLSREVQQQQQDLVERSDRLVSEREFPQCTNFFKINESPKEEEGANCQQMVEVLETAQILHEIQSTGNGIPGAPVCSPWTNTVSSFQDLSLSFEGKSSNDILEECEEEKEDMQQLGSLLRGPVSPSPKAFGRKRSLSSVLESDDLLQSPTSSENNPGAGGTFHLQGSPSKLAKTSTGKFKSVACSSCMDKDLLSLRLPNPSSYPESSSSSRGSDLRQQQQLLSGFNLSFRSSERHHLSMDEDSSHHQPLTAGGNVGSRVPSSSTELTPNENEDHHHGFLLRGFSTEKGDAAGTIHSFAEAGGAGHMLSSRSPRHEIRSQSFMIRGALHSVGGVDSSTLNDQKSLVLDADTGLEAHGLQLVHLLLKCADATAKENMELAARLLGELYQGASLYGDSMQRVAAYFAEGLAARIVSRNSAIYSSLMVQPSTEDYFSAFTTLYKVAPYFQFAHFTANQAILEAVEGQAAVHVIDLDIMQGFQWPSLIQAFGSRPGGPPHLRITGVGKDAGILQETGRRLASFAESFDVSFEFHCLVEENLECLTPSAFAPRGEATAVNSIFQLHRLLNPPSGEKLHKFVHDLCRELNPYVVTIVEQEANHNSATFLARFMEALHYYAAVFDSLDASLPQQNEERVKIEQLFYAQQIKNILACEGDERVERHETVDSWQKRMEMAGCCQIPLSSYAISQAKLLVQFCPYEGYRLHERNGAISLGWQERQLLTASAWAC